jgi:hypothetical protein
MRRRVMLAVLVLNANTELNRVVNASSTAFNRLEEIMAPRIFRLGVRFGF